jgi:periplasmic protein TonB
MQVALVAQRLRKELDMNPSILQGPETAAKNGTLVLELHAGSLPAASVMPGRQAEDYKSHSLAASSFGAIPLSPQPFRLVTAGEAQDTFLHGLLDTPLAEGHRSPMDWVISFVIHIAIVATLVILPLTFTQVIDFSTLRATYLAVPRPPAAAPAPRPPAIQERHPIRAIQPSALTMPTLIPKKIVQFKDEEAPQINVGGVAGGVEGGENGGVLGGILGRAQTGPPPPTPTPKKVVYRVGGDVKPPRELVRVDPIYSPIARTARVEGTVVIDAIIDEHGDVVHARAVSGPGLLVASALQAFMKWKYEPTYLDGTPVSIEMKVQVNFNLH